MEIDTNWDGDPSIKCDYLCRICLSKDNNDPISLFDNGAELRLCDKILICANLNLYPVDGLPNDICAICLEHLRIAFDFRSKCRDSDKILRNLYPERFKQHNLKEFTDDKCDIDTGDKIKERSSPLEICNENIESKDSLDNDNSYMKVKKLRNVKNSIENSESVEVEKVEIKEELIENGNENLFDDDDFPYNSEYSEDREVTHKEKSKKRRKKDKKKEETSYNSDAFDGLVIKDELDDDMTGVDVQSGEVVDDAVASDGTSKVYKCAECGKALSKRSSLKRHIQNMHCPQKMKRQSLTISRKTGHGKDKRFHCASCPYVTKFSQSLVYHERIHTGEKPHQCPHCNRSFSQPGSLTCHLKTHSDKTYFTCASCGRQFKHKDSYEVHKLIHSENRELFTCQICNTSLKSRKTLESHMNRHNNIKNFSCETCGLRFVTLVELINHSKKHNTEKIYKCNFCDFRTALKRSLQSHTKRHSNYRPFKCQNCDLACFTKWELRNHEKTHTRESNYTCLVCQRKFIHSSSVNKHMQRSHGVKYQRYEDVDRRKVK